LFLARSLPLAARTCFFAIRLTHLQLAKRLNKLLSSVPELASYIRVLVLGGDGEFRFWKDEVLPNILGMLHHLQSLMLDGEDSEFTYWDLFSEDFHSAFINQFKSPSLSSLKISNIAGLPFSVFSNFGGLKRLSLVEVFFKDDSSLLVPPPLALAKLEALEIQRLSSTTAWIFKQLELPALSLLSIQPPISRSSTAVDPMQQAISTAGQSIQHLILGNFCGFATNLDLGSIACIRSLSFTVHYSRWWHAGDPDPDLDWISKHLADKSITKSLEEFTVTIKFWRYDDMLAVVPSALTPKGWQGVDRALHDVPTLRKVCIFVDQDLWDMYPADDSVRLIQAVEEFLPNLRRRGIVSTRLGTAGTSKLWEM